MKRVIFMFTFLLIAGNFFQACKDGEKEVREPEILEEDETESEVYDDGAMDNSFAQYDANSDDQWDENEFSESYQGEFSGYDADTSGDLTNEEFTGATFRGIDRNRDNTINRQEWDDGYNTSFGDFTNQEDFDRFDTDKSGDLSDAEWKQGFSDSKWFGAYDVDKNKSVSSKEWSTANFSKWDKNGDGYLNQQEFQSYNTSRMGSTNQANQDNTQTEQTGSTDRQNE